jgi:hypothetical protein
VEQDLPYVGTASIVMLEGRWNCNVNVEVTHGTWRQLAKLKLRRVYDSCTQYAIASGGGQQALSQLMLMLTVCLTVSSRLQYVSIKARQIVQETPQTVVLRHIVGQIAEAEAL